MLKIGGSIDAASPTTMSRHQFNSAQWNADIGLFAKSANDFDDKESAFGDGIKKSFLGVKKYNHQDHQHQPNFVYQGLI